MFGQFLLILKILLMEPLGPKFQQYIVLVFLSSGLCIVVGVLLPFSR